MRTIILGTKFDSKKFDFRETCFGICERNGKILLTKKIVKNEIAMVGGEVLPNETHEECLKREFMEESGYEVSKIKELCTIDCFWLAGGKWPMESLANIYIIELSNRHKTPTEEGHEPLWVSIGNALDLLPLPYHKEAIKQYLDFKQTNQ